MVIVKQAFDYDDFHIHANYTHHFLIDANITIQQIGGIQVAAIMSLPLSQALVGKSSFIKQRV